MEKGSIIDAKEELAEQQEKLLGGLEVKFPPHALPATATLMRDNREELALEKLKLVQQEKLNMVDELGAMVDAEWEAFEAMMREEEENADHELSVKQSKPKHCPIPHPCDRCDGMGYLMEIPPGDVCWKCKGTCER